MNGARYENNEAAAIVGYVALGKPGEEIHPVSGIKVLH